ncbi:putative arsenite efflux transporter ArsB-like protein [Ilyonectria destructans]|nr:putative arsenite efflux transporter ArsB-like protein [Ilyonectria destructans]
MAQSTEPAQISDWQSILTFIVFLVTNIVVLFPFHIPFYAPRVVIRAVLGFLSAIRVISPTGRATKHGSLQEQKGPGDTKHFVRLRLPMNFVTAPLIADLFLLAVGAIGREEVHDGTIGANHISPIDIMAFFLTLAYIAISIDASGLIRWLAFKVLQWGGEVGHRLFFYLYAFFFALGSFIGNDPIILSGTAFLAYMTRVSKNIDHPKAWIYSQFAVANIASAILVSSNPTNLVLAGAFDIKFIHYTANMVVPVVITAVVLFPFLLYFVFADPSLIPTSIEMETLSQEEKAKAPVNPNIPFARGAINSEDEISASDDPRKLLPLEEIMNPFLDKRGAAFGAVIMATTLITVLALNAASTSSGEHPVFYVTLPAAFVMFCWDIASGWHDREKTREIARKGRREAERARTEKAKRSKDVEAEKNREHEMQERMVVQLEPPNATPQGQIKINVTNADNDTRSPTFINQSPDSTPPSPDSDESHTTVPSSPSTSSTSTKVEGNNNFERSPSLADAMCSLERAESGVLVANSTGQRPDESLPSPVMSKDRKEIAEDSPPIEEARPTTLVSLIKKGYSWLQDTFPTATVVISHLPFALVPFAFAMFVLVQALVTKGWVKVFAYGWDHWVTKTGTVGSIGGMGFLSVILCNFAGTNIGTTILLSRVIQEWVNIHHEDGTSISDRTFWGTVYSMALGVNYGAFSTAFSASLAGLLWRDILARKHIHVKAVEFARVNFPIIAIAMVVGCSALVAEVYIMRHNTPYKEFL